jgi:hypothetical protein
VSERNSFASHVEADRHSPAGFPLALVSEQAGHEGTVPLQQVDLDSEEGLTDLGTAAIDDDDVVVVGVVSGVTSGAGTEKNDLPNARAKAFAHLSREFDGQGVRPTPRFHSGMLARGAEQPTRSG